jgi:hypothetical protein
LAADAESSVFLTETKRGTLGVKTRREDNSVNGQVNGRILRQIKAIEIRLLSHERQIFPWPPPAQVNI